MLKIAFNSWLNGYKKMLCYSGRSTRSEFGFFLLFQVILFICLGIIFQFLFGLFGSAINPALKFLTCLFFLLNLLVLIPYTVRRFHDGGYTGWYCLVYIVFAPAVVFSSLFLPPTVGENKYGPDPRQISK